MQWPLEEETTWSRTSFLLKKRQENETIDKYGTEMTLITNLKGTCELFRFYLAASCCDSESKQEQVPNL